MCKGQRLGQFKSHPTNSWQISVLSVKVMYSTSDMSLKLASSFSLSCCNNRVFCSCMSSKACPVASISFSNTSSLCRNKKRKHRIFQTSLLLYWRIQDSRPTNSGFWKARFFCNLYNAQFLTNAGKKPWKCQEESILKFKKLYR